MGCGFGFAVLRVRWAQNPASAGPICHPPSSPQHPFVVLAFPYPILPCGSPRRRRGTAAVRRAAQQAGTSRGGAAEGGGRTAGARGPGAAPPQDAGAHPSYGCSRLLRLLPCSASVVGPARRAAARRRALGTRERRSRSGRCVFHD
ncbi:hypothetical protein PVAP13_7NG184685 [Panicum virgatum]|uniref:Uncharacterized protein n=1 Tax=Panicum virgatum TaxID=38727 RepID=A0A8T0PVR5_PANVG|nr:hypothetical protein PVAP13_7NG184685 [Panicum virgatum]